MKHKPLADITELFKAHRMVKRAVFLYGRPGTFIKPRRKRSRFILRQDRIASTVAIEYRYFQGRKTNIAGSNTGNGRRGEEAGKGDDRTIPFRMDAQQMNRERRSLRKTYGDDLPLGVNVP